MEQTKAILERQIPRIFAVAVCAIAISGCASFPEASPNKEVSKPTNTIPTSGRVTDPSSELNSSCDSERKRTTAVLNELGDLSTEREKRDLR